MLTSKSSGALFCDARLLACLMVLDVISPISESTAIPTAFWFFLRQTRFEFIFGGHVAAIRGWSPFHASFSLVLPR
jgi:hypothetical protein